MGSPDYLRFEAGALYHIDEFYPSGNYRTLAASCSIDAIRAAWEVIRPTVGGELVLRSAARVLESRAAG